MEETLLRDRVEIERQRDAFARLDRINGAEKQIAILQTKFDETIRSILERLEGAVSDDDLKTLKREMETFVKQAVTELRNDFTRSISTLREDISRSNSEQADRIVAASRGLMDATRLERLNEQRQIAQKIYFAVFGAALSIIAALILIGLTPGRP